jgi:hypothetical protein
LATKVSFDDVTMWVELADGRAIGVPLAWFPRLLRATPAQRTRCRIGVTGRGLHWEELDEDISVDGLLAGRSDLTIHPPAGIGPGADARTARPVRKRRTTRPATARAGG